VNATYVLPDDPALMAAIRGLAKPGRELAALADAVGYTLRVQSTSGNPIVGVVCISPRPDVHETILIGGQRQWQQRKRNSLERKLRRYADPVKLALWDAAQAVSQPQPELVLVTEPPADPGSAAPTIVAREPSVAHEATNSGSGPTPYLSATSYTATWSDGFVSYGCQADGCSYWRHEDSDRNDGRYAKNALRSLSSHWKKHCGGADHGRGTKRMFPDVPFHMPWTQWTPKDEPEQDEPEQDELVHEPVLEPVAEPVDEPLTAREAAALALAWQEIELFDPAVHSCYRKAETDYAEMCELLREAETERDTVTEQRDAAVDAAAGLAGQLSVLRDQIDALHEQAGS
jgi:hypothetical protein